MNGYRTLFNLKLLMCFASKALGKHQVDKPGGRLHRAAYYKLYPIDLRDR